MMLGQQQIYFLKCMDILEENNVENFDQINNLTAKKDINKEETYHIVLLVKDYEGLKKSI